MENLSLSVIVPVYNMEKYLETCIESLLAQTYDNLQIILVNDCSTDGSLGILNDYKSKYPDKIVVIDSKENLRQGGARNLGMKFSKSEYIGFVDADDFVHPDMYEVLMKEACKNGLDAVYCEYEKVDETATAKNAVRKDAVFDASMDIKVFWNISDEERMKIMASHKYGSVCGGVYRYKLIEYNDLYFPEHLAYEDNYWVYALQLFLENVAVVPRKLYYYRQQNGSTSHKKNAKHHCDRVEVGIKYLEFVKDKQMLQRYHDIIEFLFIEVFTLNSYSIFVNYFDRPNIDQIDYIKNVMKREFPCWRRNKFYKTEIPIRRKINMNLIMLLPVKCYLRLRKYI